MDAVDTERDCQRCLPDCSGTEYSASKSDAEFRWEQTWPCYVSVYCRLCDSHNLNTNPLCDLTDTAGTRPWGRAVREEYNSSNLPDYISSLEDPYREHYPNTVARQEEILSERVKTVPTYDAFKEDVAILNIYFGKSTALGM